MTNQTTFSLTVKTVFAMMCVGFLLFPISGVWAKTLKHTKHDGITSKAQTQVTCNATFTNACTSDDFIDEVTLNTLSNVGSGCNGNLDNYIAYPASSFTTDLTQGLSYTLTLASGPAWDENFGVWIDFNADGDFDDAGEFVYASATNEYGATVNFTVPTTATVGTVDMRVLAIYDNALTATDYCIAAGYGETEDYVINILAGASCAGTPSAGTTIADDMTACDGQPIALSLGGATTGVTGLTYQWQYSTDGISYFDIVGANSDTYTATQSMTTYYQCVVTCTGSGLNSTSVEVMVTQNGLLDCYCTPTYDNLCSSEDFIDTVMIATIMNQGSGCNGNPNNYISYDALTFTATLQQGGSYPIYLAAGPTYTQQFGVWIDYNMDGDFDDAGEFAYSTSASVANVTGNITVPSGLTQGLTKMRVRCAFGSLNAFTAAEYCSNESYGETEDYFIEIGAPVACATPIMNGAFNVTANDAEIQWACTGCTGTFIIEYGAPGFVLGTGTTVVATSSPYILTGLTPSTDYEAYVYQDCGSGLLSSASGVALFSTPALAPANDDVCDALVLNLGVNGPFSNEGATIQLNEVAPTSTGCTTQNGWCIVTPLLNNSIWFTFTPAVCGTYTIETDNFDTQLALWNAATCTDLLGGTAALVAANDDDVTTGGASPYDSRIENVSLQAGVTYYLQLDGYSDVDFGSTPITITQTSSGPIADAGLDFGMCQGGMGVLTASATGGAAPYTYTWDNGATQGGMIMPTANTVYHVTVADAGGCTSTDSIVVTVNALPSVVANADTAFCNGGSVQLSAMASNGVAPYNYTWSNGATQGGVISPTATTTYTVVATDANGCTASEAVTVTVNANPTVDAGANASFCSGGSTVLNATAAAGTAPYAYSWDNGGSQGGTVSPTATTIYTVSVTDANGCAATDNVTITVNALPVANAGTDDAICAGDSYTLNATGTAGTAPYTYSWNTGTQGGTVSPTATTTYAVTVTDANGCADTDDVAVTVNELPIADAGADTTICWNLGGTYTLNASASGGTAPYSYSWSPNGSQGTVLSFTSDQNLSYSVLVTDANGCQNTSEVIIVFETCVSIENGNAFEGTLSAYPNPTSQSLNVAIDAKDAGNVVIAVTDLAGRTIHTQITYLQTGNSLTTIPVATLANGTYMLTITDEKGATASLRFVKE